MTIRIPDQGEVAFLESIVSPDHSARLFSNDVEDGLTENDIQDLDETDFTEASFTGYSAEALTSANWTVTAGDPTEAEHTQVEFESSADQTAEVIYGYYVTADADSDALRYYEYFDAEVSVEFNGDIIRVTPKITLQDTTAHDL